MFDDLVELIDRAHVAFPLFGHGVPPAAIEVAERKLGLAFPSSYRWWLLNYGGGQVRGDLLYGIDAENLGAPDIVERARRNQEAGFHGTERLVFAIGNEEQFLFDT